MKKKYWEKIFDKVYKNKIDSWAYVWTACVWKNRGLAATPNLNLIDNIGFDESATHTFELKKFEYKKSKYKNFKKKIKILHPKSINVNKEADNYVFLNHFKGIYYLFPYRFFYFIKLFFKNPNKFILKIIKKIKYSLKHSI